MNKNRFAVAAILALLIVVLGCGRLNPLSSKGSPSTSKPQTGSAPTDGAPGSTGETTTGVTECDQAIDIIDRETNNPDDNFIARAAKATILNRIKDGIKKAVEESKKNGNADTEDLVKTCREFRDQLEKSLAEQKKNQN
ncbi:MAG: hypothetical protein R2682_11245 [Pyrinomonadaceae bacterium]